MAGKMVFPDSGPTPYTPPDERISPNRAKAEAALRRIPGVRGIGEGQDAIGNPAWLVYVTDKSVVSRLPAETMGRRVVPEVTGEIDIFPA